MIRGGIEYILGKANHDARVMNTLKEIGSYITIGDKTNEMSSRKTLDELIFAWGEYNLETKNSPPRYDYSDVRKVALNLYYGRVDR